jgi:hypothetical protein
MILFSKTNFGRKAVLKLTCGALLLPATAAMAQDMGEPVNLTRPALVITTDPIPEHIKDSIYRKPDETAIITGDQILNNLYSQPTQTLVTREISALENDLSALQGDVAALTASLAGVQTDNQTLAADYHAAVASVSTQLQAGTTPGNPRLIRLLSIAENSLEDLAERSVGLNGLSMNAADAASKANYLSESARAAFDISGAIEEDHQQLSQLQDEIEETTIVIDRVLNDVTDDILRMNTYLNVERQNLRTLSLAVSNGDMYGRSLSNVAYGGYQAPAIPAGAVAPAYPQNPNYQQPVDDITVSTQTDTDFMEPVNPMNPPSRLPLAKIRFDRPDVNYEQPVYAAMNEALEKYPNAQFDIVAIHPSQGNAAQVAIESTRARRNADKVLRTLSQMGLDLARTNLSYDESADATTSEVHIFVK